jgi:hypothetical protein
MIPGCTELNQLIPWTRRILETPVIPQLLKKNYTILSKLVVYYRAHNRPVPVPILSHSNPSHTPFYFWKIQFNNILTSMSRSCRFSKKKLSCTFPTRYELYITYATGEEGPNIHCIKTPFRSFHYKIIILIIIISMN